MSCYNALVEKLIRKIPFPLILVAILAATALSCNTVYSLGKKQRSSPTSPASPVLFLDDFSDSSSGWGRMQDTDGITDYADGTYRILVNKTQWYFWSVPGLKTTDVIIDVDVSKASGPDQNDLGVICRYQDENNFYFLTISSDGYYSVSKYIHGEEAWIGMDQPQFDDSTVKTGNATNHIRATCAGTSLSLEVNGKLLATVQDSDLASGDVGLIAGTYDQPGVDVQFDNFSVVQP